MKDEVDRARNRTSTLYNPNIMYYQPAKQLLSRPAGETHYPSCPKSRVGPADLMNSKTVLINGFAFLGIDINA